MTALSDAAVAVEIRCSSCQSSWVADSLAAPLRPDAPATFILPCPRCERAAAVLLLGSESVLRLLGLTRRYFGTGLLRVDGHGYVAAMPEGWDIPSHAASEVSREGWFALARGRDPNRHLQLHPAPAARKDERRAFWPVLLFLVTLASVFTTGYGAALSLVDGGYMPHEQVLPTALAFTLAVLAIILSHEFGHFLTARQHDIRVTWPYLIPFPGLLGTMGAIIQQRSPAPNRDAMVKMAAAGPLAGFAVTLIVLAVGIPLSYVVPAPPPPEDGFLILFGEPLLFRWLSALFGVVSGPGQEVMIHPVAMAGWFGLLLTALNLLPGGQLDGGHIVRAFLSHRAHKRATFALSVLLLPLGTIYAGWYLWAGILFLLGFLGDPGATDEQPPLTPGARLMAILCLAVIIVCFTPNPIQIVTAAG